MKAITTEDILETLYEQLGWESKTEETVQVNKEEFRRAMLRSELITSNETIRNKWEILSLIDRYCEKSNADTLTLKLPAIVEVIKQRRESDVY